MKAHKILIVDDEPDNIKAIRNCLAESDRPYILYQALNGELAIKIASIETPDLIITDWEMPGMDGIELIKRLKLDETTSDIPIIMCTGVMTSSENLHTALMAGAVDYVRKPVDKIELIARVKSMLELSDSKKVIKERYFEIEQNMKFIHALIESIPHPFVYYQPDGVIKGCNRHFENLIGKSDQDITDSLLYDYASFANHDFHRYQDTSLISNGIATSYEYELGDQVFFFSKTLFYCSAEEPEGILCIMTNITALKHAHQEILENKKRELTANAIRLINMSEMNKALVVELEKIHDQPNEKKNELIRNAISRLNIKSTENIWHEFEIHFKNVFDSFYQTINQQFPDLTPGEIKLCAFLRLNLSSKEIAALTFQNPKSIDMARYRLRKKMNLEQDENLTEFLIKIN
jgi:CheY-like chemotaxis protein/DNA-binding CsgD family transcriptional regulator